MLKNALAWGGFGLAFYLLFLIASLPLAWLWPLLPLSEKLSATGIEGTVWQGRVASLRLEQADLTGLRWQWQPGSLLGGRLQAAFWLEGNHAEPQGQGLVGLDFAGAYLTETDLRAPVDWAAALLPALPARLRGTLDLHVDRYEWADPWCRRLEGRLSWQQAGFRSVLGDVELLQADAELDCRDGALIAILSQQSTALGVAGEASLDPMRRYRLDAILTPGSGLPKGLADSLNYVGRRDPQGRYRLRYEGSL